MREQYRIRSTGGKTIASDKPIESHALEYHSLDSRLLTDRGEIEVLITSY